MKIMSYRNASCDEPKGDNTRRQALKLRTRKLLHVLRLLSVGRLGRRRASRKARTTDRRLSDSGIAEEAAFIGKVLSSAHVMAKCSQLLEPFCSSNDMISSAQIASTIHQAKVSALRIAWQDQVQHLMGELEAAKHKHAALQDQFNELRTAYLKEVATLRDDVRVRGDAQRAIGNGKMKDVAFFFEPMQALQPHELNFALQVVDEKINMIFESNPSVTPTINFGQIERLQEMRRSSEVERLKEQLRNKATNMHELEKDRRNLQRELAIASRHKQRPVSDRSAGAPTEIEQDLRPLKETPSGTETMLLKFEKKIHALQLERQEAEKEMQYHKDQQAQKEADLAACRAELQSALEKLNLAEAREAVLKEKLQFQETHGNSLHDDNEALREASRRWEARPLKYEIGVGGLRKVHESGNAKRSECRLDADCRAGREYKSAGEQSDSSCDCSEEPHGASLRQQHMITDLQLENQRLREALEQQAQAIALHSAEMDLQQAEVFAGMFNMVEENTDSGKFTKGSLHDEAASLSTTLDVSLGLSEISSESASQFSTQRHGDGLGQFLMMQRDGATLHAQHGETDSCSEDYLNTDVVQRRVVHDAGTGGSNELLHGKLGRLDAGSIDVDSNSGAMPEAALTKTTSHVEQSRQVLGSKASSAIARLRRSITFAAGITEQLEAEVAKVDGSCQTSPCASLASEAVSAVKHLHTELDAMCEVTAHVASALQATAKENVQARTGVAYVNKEILHAKAALKGSPALQTDAQLQQCLVNVQHVERATAVNNVEGVFGRLWDDTLRRQCRRHTRQSSAAVMLRPDTMIPAQTVPHPSVWYQTNSPSRDSVLPSGSAPGVDSPWQSGNKGLEVRTREQDRTGHAFLSPSPQIRRASLSPSPPPASKPTNRPTSVRRRHSAPTGTDTAQQQPSRHLQLPDAAHSHQRVAAEALPSRFRNVSLQQNGAEEQVANIGISGTPLIIRSSSPSPSVSITSTPVRSPAVTPAVSRSPSPDQMLLERSASPSQLAPRPRKVPALECSTRPLLDAARSEHKTFQSVDPLHAAALESGSVASSRNQVGKDPHLHTPRRPSTARHAVKSRVQLQHVGGVL